MIWPKIKLGDFCEVVTKGTTPTTIGKAFSYSGIQLLRVQNIRGGQLDLNTDPLFISEETHNVLSRSQIQSRDILLTIAGTIGRNAVVPNNSPPLNCNQAVAIIRLANKELKGTFVRHWLDSPDAQEQMRGAQVVAT